MKSDLPPGGLYLLHGGAGLTEADIVGNGVREQIRPLEHEGEIADETVVAVSGAYRKLQDYKAVLQEQEENLE